MFDIKSKVAEKVLGYYFINPGARHYINELARILHLDPANLDKQLKKMEIEGIFSSQLQGNLKYFSINNDYPLLNEFKKTYALLNVQASQKMGEDFQKQNYQYDILTEKNFSKSIFTETEIATKFGDFKIRVYADALGKETVVLYTKKLDVSVSVLVRIHSECMTGDTFASMQCDCGEQLEKSLEQISESGNGALIYLRQEGRGIGLFEKIKSYQLQAKGYDTFESNLLLGHRPDERTYEKAKTALVDLGVKSIRLLTNNPSKVSEIAKFGINVIERVPLLIESNKHNKHYLISKKNKFKHFFNDEVSYYFYQFHVETARQVEQVGEFLKNKKRDPLLKICVGISADHFTLEDEKEISRIENIFQTCEFYEGFVPILHFSFKKSDNPIEDVKIIKEKLSFVRYIQTNDVLKDEMKTIEAACQNFLADIPLSDKNFDLVHSAKFRKNISKYKAFVLLDNSQGRGVRETKDSLMRKIDTLLDYGLNDIAIFGGFGPDDLDTYFELRRYYKINFSIDAETKLKTNGQIDIEKTKLYLSQLVRFDDPKEAGAEQTRTFQQQNKNTDWNKTIVDGQEFLIHPAVFNSSSFPSTAWFSAVLKEKLKGQEDFCEVGCGAGVESCLLALDNPGMKVVSTDINPFAGENTKLNANRLKIGNQVETIDGDVLDGIPVRKKFDSIFWALPFGFLDPGAAVTMEEMQVFDPGYRAIRKFFNTAKNFLKEKGQLLIGFSPDLGNQDLLEELAKQAGLKTEVIAETEIQEKETIVFQVIRCVYEK